MDAPEKLLSITEAAVALGVHRDTLRRWTDAGKVPHVRLPGRHRRYRREDIAAFKLGLERPVGERETVPA